MLIESHRHSPEDLAHWRGVLEPMDRIHAQRLGKRLDAMIASAERELETFFVEGSGYVGVSWGKDSTLVAWLVHRLEMSRGMTIPVVYVRISSVWLNPECTVARDAFLRRFPLREYHEIDAPMGVTRRGRGEERLKAGFRVASERFGDRYASGVRADEGHIRRMSIGHLGLSTSRVCRPIGRWTVRDVFACAAVRDIPLHPAYGYTMGGLLDRDRVRVSNVGGLRGAGSGREGWERRYYPEVWRAAEAAGVSR